MMGQIENSILVILGFLLDLAVEVSSGSWISDTEFEGKGLGQKIWEITEHVSVDRNNRKFDH